MSIRPAPPLVLVLALSACAGSKPPSSGGPTATVTAEPLAPPSGAPALASAPAPGSASAPAPASGSASAAVPAGERAVVVRHGPMTFVMDTPPNQLRKARTALETSPLSKELAALGVAVTYEGDPKLGDAVVVLAGTTELGRGELRELTRDAPPAALLGAVKRHFGL
ncbi:MAG: hypothetical protein IT373_32865 [Polyangiaceae bacterium]|nr:hypothetical protein [Polyangiaceae bacterium]